MVCHDGPEKKSAPDTPISLGPDTNGIFKHSVETSLKFRKNTFHELVSPGYFYLCSDVKIVTILCTVHLKFRKFLGIENIKYSQDDLVSVTEV